MSRTICVTDDTPLEKTSIPAPHWPKRRGASSAMMPLAAKPVPPEPTARFIRSRASKTSGRGRNDPREQSPWRKLRTCLSVNELCESACVRAGLDQPVRIAKLQRFVTEQERKMGMQILKTGPFNGKTVACIGAGPASLACASVLAQQGYHVTIFEQSSQSGGMLSLGIPRFRLPQEIIDFDLAQIEKLGVEFRYNTTVSASDLDGLTKQFDAVFIGAGLWKPKTLDLPGKALTASSMHSITCKTPDGMTLRRKETGSSSLATATSRWIAATTAQALGSRFRQTGFLPPYRRSLGQHCRNPACRQYGHSCRD